MLFVFICSRHNSQVSLRNVLKPLTDAVCGDPLTVIVNRRAVLKSAMYAANRSQFCWTRPVNIVFSGEDAQDDGGPRREFFR